MRKSLLMSAAALGLVIGAPAFAQTTGGTGYSAGYNAPSTRAPYSTQASNINSSDIRSRIAPVLPTPPGARASDSPEQLLGIAQNELRRGQTGAAQQALEMAETNALNQVHGVVPPSMANTPSANPLVDKINQALQALGRHDRAGAEQAIQEAMAGSPGMTGNRTYGTGATNGYRSGYGTNGYRGGYGTNASTGAGMQAPPGGAMGAPGSGAMTTPSANPQTPGQTPANNTGASGNTGSTSGQPQ